LTATNTTSGTLSSVSIGAGFLQASAKVVAPLPNPDLCARGGNSGVQQGFSCFVGDLQPGGSASITFGIQPLAAGTLTINGSASFTSAALWQTTSADLSIPVGPAATDVQISGSASTGSPAPGSLFRYVFQVKNGSGQPAYGVTFSDSVPASEIPLGVFTTSNAPCSISGDIATCNLGDLPVGGQVTVTLSVDAPAVTGAVSDSASAYATNADTNPNNNTVSVTVNVK
jgi:uncharacterized repeat protein (TIGR01451 family)